MDEKTYNKEENKNLKNNPIDMASETQKQPEISCQQKNSRSILIFLVIFLVVFFAYSYFTKKNPQNTENLEKWYALKLSNGEIFYGQIQNLNSDPILIKNVYYDIDQAQKSENKEKNIRLIKRGKEAYGPDGSMNIVRSQVLYIEPMSDNSGVLSAIMDNEKEKK